MAAERLEREFLANELDGYSVDQLVPALGWAVHLGAVAHGLVFWLYLSKESHNRVTGVIQLEGQFRLVDKLSNCTGYFRETVG